VAEKEIDFLYSHQMHLDLYSLEKLGYFLGHQNRTRVAIGQEFHCLTDNARCILKRNK
jgi:hypothetical protein